MATEIILPDFDTLTSKPYTIPVEGLTFMVKAKGYGSNNNYFAIMFGDATDVKIAYGDNPAAEDFIDMSSQFALESTTSGILNSGSVRVTLTGAGTIHIVSK